MSEQIRSFIAFDIENDTVLSKLSGTQKLLVELNAELKIVEPQNIHVTIRFLGNISQTLVDKVYEVIKSVKFSPFQIQLLGLGVFPNLNYPRVVWVGMTQGQEQLKSIFSQLEPQIQALGFPRDSYGFSPHLTIARVKTGKNKKRLADFVTKKSEYDLGTINADCLRLKRSHLSPRGPTYSTLKEYCPQKG
jgi:RNA 2',3'-cyclic 3'-phosphodiesterase